MRIINDNINNNIIWTDGVSTIFNIHTIITTRFTTTAAVGRPPNVWRIVSAHRRGRGLRVAKPLHIIRHCTVCTTQYTTGNIIITITPYTIALCYIILFYKSMLPRHTFRVFPPFAYRYYKLQTAAAVPICSPHWKDDPFILFMLVTGDSWHLLIILVNVVNCYKI